MLRRLGSVLVAFLLLPQLQVGSWTPCTLDRGMSGAESGVEREMPGMLHCRADGGGKAARSSASQDASTASNGSNAANDCHSPRAPRDASPCASAMTCNVIVPALTMAIANSGDTPAPLDLPEPVTLHSTSAPAPEPPPPRA